MSSSHTDVMRKRRIAKDDLTYPLFFIETWKIAILQQKFTKFIPKTNTYKFPNHRWENSKQVKYIGIMAELKANVKSSFKKTQS